MKPLKHTLTVQMRLKPKHLHFMLIFIAGIAFIRQAILFYHGNFSSNLRHLICLFNCFSPYLLGVLIVGSYSHSLWAGAWVSLLQSWPTRCNCNWKKIKVSNLDNMSLKNNISISHGLELKLSDQSEHWWSLFGQQSLLCCVQSTRAPHQHCFLLEVRAPFTSVSFKVQWSNSSIQDILLLPQQPEFWMFLHLDVPLLLIVTRNVKSERSASKQWDDQLCGSHCLNIYCNSVSKMFYKNTLLSAQNRCKNQSSTCKGRRKKSANL